MKKGIIWLASYPRSGNTWLRIVLSQLTDREWDPAELNAIPIGFPVARQLFDELVGVESSNLTLEQIELLRPRMYELLHERLGDGSPGPLFFKTHDAWTLNARGEPVLSPSSAGAVYIVRNPLDVAVSFARFMGREVEHAIQVMERREAVLAASRRSLSYELPQRVLSWSEHVRSWLEDATVPVHLVRYEEMKARPVETVAGIVRFCGLDVDEGAIQEALEAASFERLQALERTRGFREKSQRADRFFRRGVAGSWREVLTDAQVGRIIEAHGTMMRRLGYLDEAGDPLW